MSWAWHWLCTSVTSAAILETRGRLLNRELVGKTTFFSEGVWRCPSAEYAEIVPHDISHNYYGYNGFGVLRIGNLTDNLGLIGNRDVGVRDSEVTVPAGMVAIGDSFSSGYFFMREPSAQLARFGNTQTRHQARANVLFCDAHVESPALRSLFDDTSDEALALWNRDHLPHRDRQ